ncbi:DUF6236 family protein [Stutzerimonas nitrititolerans]|uniref:DUF6236 family protein n=1 Tax=Stutzerimonas nitrititolerans TaxID=2482751 RepID=UPI001BDCC977|nr:DUF6236 family protein [Stutzerimonas nitrititolerans]MBT1118658.1 hypothetical protein [Stutzerimonas nitrititolerans]
MEIERGIIANPGIINPLPDGFRMERSITIEEISYYILYWDKVVIPGNNLVYIGVPQEEELISCGAIMRPRVQFNGSFRGDMVTNAILSCQGIVAKELAKDRKVDWVLHQAGKDLCIESEYTEMKDLLRFDLVNSLPVPLEGTPLNEILEFRDKRKSDLSQLHSLLDELYIDILKSPDQSLAAKQATHRLATHIKDLEIVVGERFKKTRKYDLSTSININFEKIASGAAVGAIIDMYASGLTFPLATVAGALAPLIKMEAKASYSFEPAKDNLKLSYLSHASSVGIIAKS